MPKRLPIKVAKQIGAQYTDVSQVIVMAWDGKSTHLVTWGRSLEDCDQAAQGGNRVKEALGWPEHLMDEPSRVKQMRAEIKELKRKLKALE